ncbi:MAG: hypothetical protein RMK18_10690 [Armatimonadota bacterium]|nr:hypothetical protein [Armatimonadota bacterium]MDW8026312.1 hypothetical protein [Armatimonadota bacterium]
MDECDLDELRKSSPEYTHSKETADAAILAFTLIIADGKFTFAGICNAALKFANALGMKCRRTVAKLSYEVRKHECNNFG